MNDLTRYTPILKWRMGEYQALFRLPEEVKGRIRPLVVIPPVEYDFEKKRLKCSVEDHVNDKAKSINAKWGDRLILIDIEESLEMECRDNGDLVIASIFSELRELGCDAIPVIRISQTSQYLEAIGNIIEADKKGVALRLGLHDMLGNSSDMIGKILAKIGAHYSEVDVVLDLGKLENFEPYEDLSSALNASLRKIPLIDAARSFTLCSTSLDVSSIARPGATVPRHEWLFYKHIVANEKFSREPEFGDYGIDSPEFPSLDFRLVGAAGKLIYSLENDWVVIKGTRFRDNPAQMIHHCNQVVGANYYCGKEFSWGDRRIFNTATKSENPGNLSTWKQAGVSHHIALVSNQLASQYDSQDTA